MSSKQPQKQHQNSRKNSIKTAAKTASKTVQKTAKIKLRVFHNFCRKKRETRRHLTWQSLRSLALQGIWARER
jgi:hypothetical protein